jgi:CspA family cold shock protein
VKHTENMLSHGTVREWSDEDGWGVIDSAETPGGCWTHFSVIVSQGYRSLEPGSQVAFTYEAPGQDGFGYRAVQVWPSGVGPEAPQQPSRHEPSAAYRSSLTIRRQNGSLPRAHLVLGRTVRAAITGRHWDRSNPK